MNLNYAANLLDESFVLNESIEDNSIKQAITWLINYYKRVNGGFDASVGYTSNRGGTTHDVSKAEQLVTKIESDFAHPFDWDHRQKWTKVFLCGLTRILVEELGYGTSTADKDKIELMKSIYQTAIMKYHLDNSFMDRDTNLKGMSFNQLRIALRPFAREMRARWQAEHDACDAEALAAAAAEDAAQTEEPEERVVRATQATSQTNGPYEGFAAPYQQGAFKIGDYNGVKIDTHEQAHTWVAYTNDADGRSTLEQIEDHSGTAGCHWCIAERSGYWDDYTSHTAYFFWKDNFNQLNRRDFSTDDNGPHTEWGESLVCMMVDPIRNGEYRIYGFTSRYNHCDDHNDFIRSGEWGDNFLRIQDINDYDERAAKVADFLGCSTDELRRLCPHRDNSAGVIDHTDADDTIRNAGGSRILRDNAIFSNRPASDSNIGLWFLEDQNETTLMNGNERITPFWFKRGWSKFAHGYLLIKKDGKQNIINSDGKLILPVGVDDITFSSNYINAVIRINDKYNIINLASGRILFRNAIPEHPLVLDVYGKYIPAKAMVNGETNGITCFYSRFGKKVDVGTDNNENFRDYKYAFRDFIVGGGRRGHTYLYKAPKMTVICELVNGETYSSMNRKYLSVKYKGSVDGDDSYNNKYVIFDENCNLVEGVKFMEPPTFNDGSVMMFGGKTADNTFTVYDENGKELYNERSTNPSSCAIFKNIVRCYDAHDDVKNLIYSKGELIPLPVPFSNIKNEHVHNAHCAIIYCGNDKYAVLDEDGRITYRAKELNFSFTSSEDGSTYYSFKNRQNLCGLIDNYGKVIVPPIYSEHIRYIGAGCYLVLKRNNLYNIISANEDYEEILTKDFNSLITEFSVNGIANVFYGNAQYFINIDGDISRSVETLYENKRVKRINDALRLVESLGYDVE